MRCIHVCIHIDLEIQRKHSYFLSKTEITDTEKDAVNNVLNFLEAEPSSDSDHREQLTVLVSSGKAREMIGQDRTQD